MKKVVTIVSVFLLLVGISLIFLFVGKDEKEDVKCTKDAKKFKEEYEELVGEKVTIDNKKYSLRKVDIVTNNPISYIKKEEVVDKLTKGTGVIFFGSSADLFSREAVPVLLTVGNEFDCKIIYYYDVSKVNNSEDETLFKQIKDVLADKFNQLYGDSEKLVMPTVLFIKDGKIKKYHVGLVDSYISYDKKLSDKQVDELSKIYRNGFKAIDSEVCDIQQQC